MICDNIATSTPVEVRLSQNLRMMMLLPCRSMSLSRSMPMKATGPHSKICVAICRTTISALLSFMMLGFHWPDSSRFPVSFGQELFLGLFDLGVCNLRVFGLGDGLTDSNDSIGFLISNIAAHGFTHKNDP